MHLGLGHRYAALPAQCHAPVQPEPAPAPQLLAFNRALAAELGLDPTRLEAVAAELFSGRQLPDDARPLAMAYAGHQFGHFSSSLGDGRALLLGELQDRSGHWRDLHLKGSGRTPFSRSGDGRAAVGPMLREYVVSEGLHALGIATTRALAVVATGEPVYRERPLPGAVLARVAASHLRVGTFEYFAARGDTEAVSALFELLLERHDPAAREAPVPALAALEAIAARQAQLVAQWMLVGFVHGVMNTDNMALSGETIDFGPCAFLEHYHPRSVFSAIDQQGRYAYANQPLIAQWNLARLAETLLPLIDADTERAVQQALPVVEGFLARFEAQLREGLAHKLGWPTASTTADRLGKTLLETMQAGQADFTLTFRQLADVAQEPDGSATQAWLSLFETGARADAGQWLADWQAQHAQDGRPGADLAQALRTVNPLFIPRNHHVEAALAAASERGDMAPFERLLDAVQRPFDEQPQFADLALPARPAERVTRTFCGT